MANKQTLTIEFDAINFPILAKIFKKFEVKIKSKKPHSKIENNDEVTPQSSKEPFGNPKQSKPKFGFLKGQFKMASDFDAPLEDFKDYM